MVIWRLHSICKFASGIFFLALVSSPIRATIWAFPKFGTAIVSGNYLAFTDVNEKRVICVNRGSGTKLWEVEAPGGNARLSKGGDGRIYLGAKGAFYEINLDGELKKIFENKFVACELIRSDETGLLIGSLSKNSASVSLHDKTTGKLKWKRDGARSPLALTDNILLQKVGRGTGTRTSVRALDVQNGKTLWTKTFKDRVVECESVGEYFLFGLALDLKELRVYQQRSGELVRQINVGPVNFHLVMYQGFPVVWWHSKFSQTVKFSHIRNSRLRP